MQVWIRVGTWVLCAWFAPIVAMASPVLPGSPTDQWTIIDYQAPPDPSGDQGTGDDEGDIVGDANDAAFYTQFDDNGTSLIKTDGRIGFRIRISSDNNPGGWDNFLIVGLDVNEDASGDIDIFLGVDGQGSGDAVGIYLPGTGSNTSPSTTSIQNPPVWSETLSASNFDFSQVNATIDPGVTTTDFGNNGTDFFLSFSIPFAEIVTQLANSGITFDDETGIRYVLGTSTQPNALNQDVGGTAATWSSDMTWAELNAMSLVTSASGVIIPEPGSLLLLSSGLLMLAGIRRKAGR